MTFVAAYWWKVKPGYEDQFRLAWRHGTELIRQNYGSFGSRLHRDDEDRWIGMAEWPDRPTWKRAFDAGMNYGDEQVRTAFLESLAGWGAEPLLLMELIDDMLRYD